MAPSVPAIEDKLASWRQAERSMKSIQNT